MGNSANSGSDATMMILALLCICLIGCCCISSLTGTIGYFKNWMCTWNSKLGATCDGESANSSSSSTTDTTSTDPTPTEKPTSKPDKKKEKKKKKKKE